MKNLFIIGLLLCNYLLHTQTLSPLQKTRIDSAQKVMEKLAIQKGKFDTAYARSMHNTALLYQEFGDISNAETLLYEEMEVYTMQGANMKGQRTKPYLEAKLHLAMMYFKGVRFSEAIEIYKETLDLSKYMMGEDSELFIQQLLLLTNAYHKTGFYTEANARLEEVNKIYATYNLMDRIDYVTVVLKTAEIMTDVKLYVDTAELLETTIDNIDKNRYRPYKNCSAKDIKINLQLALAKVYRLDRKFVKAENLYRLVLKDRKETSEEYIETLEGLAITLQKQKKYTEAISLFERQKNHCNKKFGENSIQTAFANINLADFFAIQEKLSEAQNHYNKAIEIFKSNKEGEEDANYALVLSKLGNLYDGMYLFQNAIEPYQQCLAIRRATLGEESAEYLETLNDLATVYTKLRLYEKAEPYYREYITTLNAQIISRFPALNDAEKAAYYGSNKPYFENFMRYAIDRSGANPYTSIANSQKSQKIVGDLYNLQLSTKAILLSASSSVRNKILSSKDTALINTYKKWVSYREQIAQYKTFKKTELQQQGINLDSLEKSSNNLERNLVLQSTAFAKNANLTVTLPTWQDVQKELREGEAAIEIISLPYRQDTTIYIALIVKKQTQEQPEVVVLGKGKEMETVFLKFYRNGIKYKLIDKESYNRYWKPIAEKLEGISKVYVSPDGAFHQVNLNTLWNTNTEKYLLDETNITLLTNTKDILEHNIVDIAKSLTDLQKDTPKPIAVLIGRPYYHLINPPEHPLTNRVRGGTMDLMRGVSFVDLLGTEREIVQIDSTLKSIQFETRVFTKEKANELLIKNLDNILIGRQSPTILHIATHGFFLNNSDNLTDPMLRSGIALAGINDYLETGDKWQGEDGILKASELMLRDLSQTEIVGVSACETGLGDIKNGEGVYGLQRALKVAGAKAIIMSLWKVDDTATQLLMSSFYDAYKTMNKREAFKTAQQRLKETYKQPFYWGAFVMVGE